MDEMSAYSMAVAHLNITHNHVRNMMVSAAGAYQQDGWEFVDYLADLPDVNPCEKFIRLYPADKVPRLPSFIHYCQFHYIKDQVSQEYHVWHKFSLKDELINDCSTPLMTEPHPRVWDQAKKIKDPRKRRMVIQMTFWQCTLHLGLNHMLSNFRKLNCPAGKINNQKTWHIKRSAIQPPDHLQGAIEQPYF